MEEDKDKPLAKYLMKIQAFYNQPTAIKVNSINWPNEEELLGYQDGVIRDNLQSQSQS